MEIELRISDPLIADSIVRYLVYDKEFSYNKTTNRFRNDRFTVDEIPKEYLVGKIVNKGGRFIWIDHSSYDSDTLLEIHNLTKSVRVV